MDTQKTFGDPCIHLENGCLLNSNSQNSYCPNRSGAQHAGHQKNSPRNEEIVGLDSCCISIDIWPKSSYMKTHPST